MVILPPWKPRPIVLLARHPTAASVLITVATWMKVWPAALIAALVIAACGDDDTVSKTVEQLQDPATCMECHPKHVQQWQASMHAFTIFSSILFMTKQFRDIPNQKPYPAPTGLIVKPHHNLKSRFPRHCAATRGICPDATNLWP